MKKNRLLSVLLLIGLVVGPLTFGCSDNDTPAASIKYFPPPTRAEPPYDWADPLLGARLDEALELWADDFGIYGAAAAVMTPDWMAWTGQAAPA